MIDFQSGNYVWGAIAFAASIPIAGIVFDAMKQGRNAERVASNITKFTKRLKDGSAYMKELQIPDGYSIVKGVFSEGAEVFTNGKVFISPDVTSHNGAIWKMAKKVEWLKNPSKRMGGYDELLNWIHK